MGSVKHLLAVIVLALGLTSTAEAQQRAERLLLQGYGGYVFVSGVDLIDDGWRAGGLLGVAVTSHVWLMGSFSYLWHGEQEIVGADTLTVETVPGWNNRSYFGMLGYDIVPTGMNGNFILFVGAGSVRFDPEADTLETRTYFGLNGGIKIAYDFSRHVAGTLDVAAAVAFSEEEYVGGNTWLFPVGLGLALRF